jgi:hypothetical protein
MIIEWLYENKISGEAEKIMINHDLRYCGRADLIGMFGGKKMVIDWKTQNVTSKPKFYPEWSYQLAAYKLCDPTIEGMVSVVISSNPSNLVISAKEYTESEIIEAENIFTTIRRLYSLLKKL